MAGEVLRHLYDYRDDWHHTLRVELVASGDVDGAAFDLDRTDAEVRAAARASDVGPGLPTAPHPMLEQMADRVQWLFDRAEEDALPMTGAGWLAPAVVRRAWEEWDVGLAPAGAGRSEWSTGTVTG